MGLVLQGHKRLLLCSVSEDSTALSGLLGPYVPLTLAFWLFFSFLFVLPIIPPVGPKIWPDKMMFEPGDTGPKCFLWAAPYIVNGVISDNEGTKARLSTFPGHNVLKMWVHHSSNRSLHVSQGIKYHGQTFPRLVLSPDIEKKGWDDMSNCWRSSQNQSIWCDFENHVGCKRD